jgi:hypothetical protein
LIDDAILAEELVNQAFVTTNKGVEELIDEANDATENAIDGTDQTSDSAGEVDAKKTLNDVVKDDSDGSEETIDELQDDTNETDADGEDVVDNAKGVRDEAIEETKSHSGNIEHGVVSNEGVDEGSKIATKDEIETDIGVDDDVVDDLSTSTYLEGNGYTEAVSETRSVEDQVTSYEGQVGEEIVSDTGDDLDGSQNGGDYILTFADVEAEAKTERGVPDNVVEYLRGDNTKEYLDGGTNITEEIVKDVVNDLDVEDVGDGLKETTDEDTYTSVFEDLQQTNVGQDVVFDQNVYEVVNTRQINTVTVNAVQNEVLKDDVGSVVKELNTVDETRTDLSEKQVFELNERRTETQQYVGRQQDVGVDAKYGEFSTTSNTTNGNQVAGSTKQTSKVEGYVDVNARKKLKNVASLQERNSSVNISDGSISSNVNSYATTFVAYTRNTSRSIAYQA